MKRVANRRPRQDRHVLNVAKRVASIKFVLHRDSQRDDRHGGAFDGLCGLIAARRAILTLVQTSTFIELPSPKSTARFSCPSV